MRFILLTSLIMASAQADQTANEKDVAYWIDQAKKNVNEDLPQWPEIVHSGDRNQMHKQLQKLQNQINDACKNMKRFVPVLSTGVSGIHYLAQGGWLKRLALKGAVNLLYGRRDNKSYYLLDGASTWINVRMDELKKDGKHDELATDLTALNSQTISVRDELDGNAQIFVTNLKDLHGEVNSDEPNPENIKKIADKMYDGLQGIDPLLKNNQALMDRAKDIVNKYYFDTKN